MTDHVAATTDHEHTAVIAEAGAWIASGGAEKGRPLVPQLKERYGMSALEACEAIREANLIRARSN